MSIKDILLLVFYFNSVYSSEPTVCSALQLLPDQLLHKVQPDALCHKHCLASERPYSKAATATRSESLWHQQVLSSCPKFNSCESCFTSSSNLCKGLQCLDTRFHVERHE